MYDPLSEEDDDAPTPETGFTPLAELRVSRPRVTVVNLGSDEYSEFVTAHVNALPHDTNLPLVVTVFGLLYDVLITNPLEYAVGAEPPERGQNGGAWAYNVLPNRADAKPTVAVVIIPGGPGVGKTTTIQCAPSQLRHARCKL